MLAEVRGKTESPLMESDVQTSQREVCHRYGTEFVPYHASDKLGLSANVRSGLKPLNGLRHPPHRGTSSWYIWAGVDLRRTPDFFKPIHVRHIADVCPAVVPYLGLPPGWRFLISEGHEDVWFDEELLKVR